MKYFLFLFFTNFYFFGLGQLTGTAVLNGRPVHNSIVIRFIAAGGNSVSDSTYAEISGTYTANITTGYYYISFSAPGFITDFYANTSPVLLSNSTSLNTFTLMPKLSLVVAGDAYGFWPANNIYSVVGDINIPEDSVLTIAPGTRIEFDTLTKIGGKGKLIAQGTSANKILFTSSMPAPVRSNWKGIILNSTGPASEFDNCIIEYADNAIGMWDGCANVSNSVIRHLGSCGIYILEGELTIEFNEIYDVRNITNPAVGIYASTAATGSIGCNYVHDIHSNGAGSCGIINHSCLANNNHILNISGNSPRGIQSRSDGARNINNFIFASGIGIDVDGTWEPSNPVIANNTIHGNDVAIFLSANKPTNVRIVNNLISQNTVGIKWQNANPNLTFLIDHNLFWKQTFNANLVNVSLSGLGQTLTVNNFGYGVDNFGNLFQDPLYSSPIPSLQLNSPCLVNGEPAFGTQIGFDQKMTCISNLVGIPKLYEIVRDIQIFPNPNNGRFKLGSESGHEYEMSVFDINARKLFSVKIKTGDEIELRDLINGIYFVQFIDGTNIINKRIVILK